jgi:hypothetical protein
MDRVDEIVLVEDRAVVVLLGVEDEGRSCIVS